MAAPSLDSYRTQLQQAADQVGRSADEWRDRQRTFQALLTSWQAFPQLKQNPVDGLRLDFLQQEIDKHQTQLVKCQENLKKFDDLERQMRALAVEETAQTGDADGDECIDIREELDDQDRVISVKLTPQRHAVLDAMAEPAEEKIDVKGKSVEGKVKPAEAVAIVAEDPAMPAGAKKVPTQSAKSADRQPVAVASQVKERPMQSAKSMENAEIDSSTAAALPITTATPLEGMPTFTLVEGPDGHMEMVADNAGMVPQVAMLDDLHAMNEICEDLEDEEEDAYGRTRVEIPLPSLLQRKKRIVFAEELHQGPSAGKLRPTTPILKRATKYPLPDEGLPAAPIVVAPTIMADVVEVKRGKGNLANLDLDPEEGAVKKPMMVRRLTDDELQVIRQKREAMGKKHKRRKSVDPVHPVRSGSWDEHQPAPAPAPPASADGSQDAAKLARVKELLAAQDDIAWANGPISPEEIPRPVETPEIPILAPKPRKAPTPERKNSYNANIPSPLAQSTVASAAKEVAFSETVLAKLEPLAGEPVLPTVVEKRLRKMPPADRQPSRQSSIDPTILSPTPRSPPPQDRERGPVSTEGQGSVSHYMVRSTVKSPPPHVAIHDLLGDQPAEINDSIRGEALGYFEQQAPPPHPDEILPQSVKANQVMTDGIVERSDAPALLSEDQQDEAELALHKKEAAQAYHKLRSRMIQAQGGYIDREEEGEEVPLEEKPKMSRFKAARLAGGH